MKSAIHISFAAVFAIALLAAFAPVGDIYASACCGGDGPGPDGSHGRDFTPPNPPTYVQPKVKPACKISVNPSTVEKGSATTIKWTSTNAYTASLSTFGTVAINGSRSSGALSSSQTFTLTVTGAGGTATCSTEVTVTTPPPPPEPEKPTCDISADDTALPYGQGTTVRWNSENATSATLTQFGSVSVDGTRFTGALFASKTYTLTVTGEGGTKVCSVTIEVEEQEEPEKPSCTIWADDTSLTSGESTTLRWDSINATSATLTQFGSVSLDGTRNTGALFSTKTYILTATGEGGSVQCSVSIGVLPQEEADEPSCDIWADDESIAYGQGTTLRWNSENATSASLTQFGSVSVDGTRFTGALYSSKTYTLTVYGEGGSHQCTVSLDVDDEQEEEPSCDIWADDTYLEDGQSTVLRWNSENATSATLSNFGSVSVEGSRGTGALYSERTYTLNVRGNGGSAQCSITIEVDDEYTPPNYNDEPSCWIHVTTTYQSGYNNYNNHQMTLSWGSENATWATITGVGQVSPSGSRSVYGNNQYTMTVWGPGGSAICETEVDYVPPPTYIPPPINPIPPYITLTQIPYTGFDLGLVGNAMLWLSITLVAALGVVMLGYYRSDMFTLPSFGRGVKKNSRLAEFLPDESISFTPVRFLA